MTATLSGAARPDLYTLPDTHEEALATVSAALADALRLAVQGRGLPSPGETTVLHEDERTSPPGPRTGPDGTLLVPPGYQGDYRPDGRSWVEVTRTRVSLRRATDGALTVICTTSERRHGFTRPRGDNPLKVWCRWGTTNVTLVSVASTGEWLVRTGTKTSRSRGLTWRTARAFRETTPQKAPRRALFLPTVDLTPQARAAATLLLPAPAAVEDVYPLHAHYTSPNIGQPATLMPAATSDVFLGLPAFKAAFRGARDAQDLTRALFGKTRYRRDLVKEVAQARLPDLCVAWQFRGLVPVDWLVTFLRDMRARRADAAAQHPMTAAELRDRGRRPVLAAPHVNQVPLLRPHLRALDQRSLRRLLRDEEILTQRWGNLVRDLGKWPADRDVTRVDSWEDLHDVAYISLQRADRRARHGKRSRRATLPPEALALNGTTADGLRVEIADRDETLWHWSNLMRHCIGSYVDQMLSGSSWLGGVFNGDVLVANFEVAARDVFERVAMLQAAAAGADPDTPHQHPAAAELDRLRAQYGPLPGDPDGPERGTRRLETRLSQLLGKHNRTLPEAQRADITEHLANHGVDVPSDYWGSR